MHILFWRFFAVSLFLLPSFSLGSDRQSSEIDSDIDEHTAQSEFLLRGGLHHIAVQRRLPSNESQTLHSLEVINGTDRHTSSSENCVDKVAEYFVMYPGTFLCSKSEIYFFGVDLDGDLALWKGNTKVWSAGRFGLYAVFQNDGNLVLRDANLHPLWSSETHGVKDEGAHFLSIEDSGVVTVRNPIADKTLQIVPSNVESKKECQNQLTIGQTVLPGTFICSQDSKFMFGLSPGGQLAIYNDTVQMWTANSCCHSGLFGKFQMDGNFVLQRNNKVLWTSSTRGPWLSNSRIAISTTGVVQIGNKDSGKMLSIDPKAHSQTLRTLSIASKGYETRSCQEQVVGRTSLSLGEFICSSDGNYLFGISIHGFLALFSGTDIIWSIKAECNGECVTANVQNDGNLVVVNHEGAALWKTRTSSHENYRATLSLYDTGTVALTNRYNKRIWAMAPTPRKDKCLEQIKGRILVREGYFICSKNVKYRLGIFEGDLSLWEYHRLLWSAGTVNGDAMLLRQNGKLVVLDGMDRELWSASSRGDNGSSLVLTSDGVPKILSSNGAVVWTSTMQANSREIEYSNDF